MVIKKIRIEFFGLLQMKSEKSYNTLAFGKIKTNVHFSSFHITFQDQKINYITKINKTKLAKTIWETKLIFSSTIELENKERQKHS